MTRREMFFVMLFLLLWVVAGCQLVGDSVDNYAACKNDPACMAQMYSTGNMTGAAVAKAVEYIPPASGYAGIIGSIVGVCASLVCGVFLGKKIKKEV